MSDPSQLYDRDFYLWTQEQADLLRHGTYDRLKLPIDWDHIADEIEQMGRQGLVAVNERIGLILEHLLKLEHSPDPAPRDRWIEIIGRCREDVARSLDDSPSLRRKVAARWPREYALARCRAERVLSGTGNGHAVAGSVIPAEPAYTLDQVLDPDWWPDNRFGLAF